jgi:hypothetical protein
MNSSAVHLASTNGGFYLIDQTRVNLDDLISALNNQQNIVRVDGDVRGSLSYVCASDDDQGIGCVAGMISDEA